MPQEAGRVSVYWVALQGLQGCAKKLSGSFLSAPDPGPWSSVRRTPGDQRGGHMRSGEPLTKLFDYLCAQHGPLLILSTPVAMGISRWSIWGSANSEFHPRNLAA